MEPRHANGLDKLRADNESGAQPFEATLGLRLVEASRGRALFRATAVADHSNASGAMHGGWIAGLLDAVTGAAAATVLEQQEGYATVSLHISYLRAVTAGMIVEVEGRVVSEGGRIVTSSATATCEGKALARGEATCMRLPAGPA